MAIRSLARSSIRQVGRVNSALAGYESNYFHHLETVRLGGNAASVTFSNLSRYSDYQHFQVRVIVRTTTANLGGDELVLRFNNDAGNNYRWHRLSGDGGSVTSAVGSAVSYIRAGEAVRNGGTTGAFHGTIIDILDPFDTTKNTTVRVLTGISGVSNPIIGLFSGLWINTSALTDISFLPEANNLLAGSRFSLYGLKARA